MSSYLCIYFDSPTEMYKADEALTRYRINHRILRLSENLATKGCSRCIVADKHSYQRVAYALKEENCHFREIKVIK